MFIHQTPSGLVKALFIQHKITDMSLRASSSTDTSTLPLRSGDAHTKKKPSTEEKKKQQEGFFSFSQGQNEYFCSLSV